MKSFDLNVKHLFNNGPNHLAPPPPQAKPPPPRPLLPFPPTLPQRHLPPALHLQALPLCLLHRRCHCVKKLVFDGLGLCKEGRGEFTKSEVRGEVRVLLQGYFEDQLVLLVGSLYNCGDNKDER